MDKAQGSRPLDKASPADPDLQERGLAEQKVNLEGCAREDGLELSGMGILSQTISETGQPGLNTLEARTEQRGAGSQQKVLEYRRVYWEFRKTGKTVLEGSQVARRVKEFLGNGSKLAR